MTFSRNRDDFRLSISTITNSNSVSQSTKRWSPRLTVTTIHCHRYQLACDILSRAILILQRILVLVFILFLGRNFYFYIVLVFPVIIILVFIWFSDENSSFYIIPFFYICIIVVLHITYYTLSYELKN